MSMPWWNLRNDGTEIPARTMKVIDTHRTLRARAMIRLEIARQDKARGDELKAAKNETACDQMLSRSWLDEVLSRSRT